MTTDQSDVQLETCADVIEQYNTKLDELVKQIINSKNIADVDMKNVWQKALILWRTAMEYMIDSAAASDAASYADCSYIFYNKIFIGLDLENRLEKDGPLCYEMFYSSLDLLTVLVIDRHHLTNDDISTFQNNTMNNYFYISMALCISACNFVPFDDRLVNDYIPFFINLKAYADKKVASELSSGNEGFDRVTSEILILFWCMANRTILVPSMIRLDLPKHAVKWLSDSGYLNAEATEPLIRIIYNMARHDDGADEYNKLGALEIVKQYQRRDEIAQNNKLSLCCSLAIALLSTPEQLKEDQKGMNTVLDQLLQLTMEAAGNEDFTCVNVRYHVAHLVGVLAKLFVVDERTVDYIMLHAETEPSLNKASTVKLFADLLIAFSDLITSTDPLNQFSCIALYNIVWSISFQGEYQEELKNNTQLIDTIKRLATDEHSQTCDQYKPRAMQSIKKAADGILYNLHMDATSQEDQSKKALHRKTKDIKESDMFSNKKDRSTTDDSLPLVMFSYAHKDDKFCYQILKEVERMNDKLKVWIDIQHCATGDLWEKIADAIENADVILCFISEYYQQSKSCRQEFIYAVDDLQKPIIPILIGDYKPKGWLGIRKAGMKYVRFRNPSEPNESNMKDLIERIQAEISHDKNIIISSTAPVHHEVPAEPTYHETPKAPVHYDAPVEPVHYDAPVEPVHYDAPVEPVHYDAPVEPVHYDAPVEPVRRDASTDPMPHETPIELIHHETPIELIHHETLKESAHSENPAELVPSKSPVQETSSVTVDLPPIDKWAASDIRRWFQQEGIMDEIYDLYRFRSGLEMLDYAQILSKDRYEQRKIYSQIFKYKHRDQILPPHEFHRFAKAMARLLKENTIEQKPPEQSSTCTIL
ncbi:unnamed protein product [Adineta ricciae]|uniref:TIR domain-containing protein n=1 Tax=Adineta ricciae TaxID=249248 RepID=A0A815M6L3_ADIRI|nr:unnamed protein product [Adineta ricciae]